MKTLELNFQSSDLRLKVLRLKYVNTDLSANDVAQIMTKMAATGLFAKGTNALYATPVDATLVETTKTTLTPEEPDQPAPTPAPVG